MRMYEVGGCVRDGLLGLPSKDIDFAIVLDEVEGDPFLAMCNRLKMNGFVLIDETAKPEFVTVRGFFPKDHGIYPGKAADFVLARKESGYSDGRHPDLVRPGSLSDDLARRDFTMNAIAKDEDGWLIDPHGGRKDIARHIIRAVGDPLERLSEDPLRALRALRFSVTKGFTIDRLLQFALREPSIHEGIVGSVADERIADELGKMFRFDSVKSVLALNMFPALTAAAFQGRVSLDSTLKTKGRGK